MGQHDRRPGKIVGRCAMCGLPVLAQVQVRVPDPAVRTSTGRPVRRLAHAGRCELELQHRLGTLSEHAWGNAIDGVPPPRWDVED